MAFNTGINIDIENLIFNWSSIIYKIVFVIFIIILFHYLTDTNYIKTDTETFIDKIENQKINYLKLRETYIENSGTSLELLYANYNGDAVGKDVWENKTLDQCTDTCNKIEGCVGFSRDLVLDTEPANCYPRSSVNSKCHSNRKGNIKQMQKAIKYNSFVKSNVQDVLNNCIGDADLTLNRLVFIKSQALPNEYIGNSSGGGSGGGGSGGGGSGGGGSGGDARALMIDRNDTSFKLNCNFRIEMGKDGIGTISFLHIASNKYLYRDSNNTIILKDISSGKTEDKQRVSFNIYDASSNEGVMLRALPIEGETTDKYINIDGKYLNCVSTGNSGKNNSNASKSTTKSSNTIFYIVESIIDSNIITNKTNIPQHTNNNMPQHTNNNMPQTNNNNMPQYTNNNMQQTNNNIPQYTNNMPNTTKPIFTKKALSIQEDFTVKLDDTSSLPVYYNLFNTPKTVKINDYLQDTYSVNSNPAFMSVSNKINDIITSKELSNSSTKKADEYYAILEINKEIEKEIANLNIGLNGKNDKIINKLDNMRISDMANDYFYLQNIINK